MAKKALAWNPRGRRKTQDYMAKHSEDRSRISREELAANKILEQIQDPMVSFHTQPMPLPTDHHSVLGIPLVSESDVRLA
jgi:hypothetical protein